MLNKVIFITGTPGTGKTTIATILYSDLSKNYDSKLVKINELAINNDLILDEDEKKGYKILDMIKVDEMINEILNSFFNQKNNFNTSNSSNSSKNLKIAIIEGHLSHLVKLIILIALIIRLLLLD